MTVRLWAVIAVVAGCLGAPADLGRPADTSQPGPLWTAVPAQVAVPPSATAPPRHAPPAWLRIPSIGVTTALVRLSTDARGELMPPRDPQRAGWYAGGVRPGDRGPAVIAGHVDSGTGPAVFARLGRLRPGAAAIVTDADGHQVAFRIDTVVSYPKADFPTQTVYGATPGPELRLITCGGRFNTGTGHYVDNVIAFASLSR